MKSNRRTYAGIAIGLIVMALTVLLFFMLVEERQSIHWVSLAFLVLAELVATIGFSCVSRFAQNSPGIIRSAGVYSMLGLYFVAALIVSLIYLLGLGDSLRKLISVQAVIVAIVGIAIIMLTVGSRSVGESNQEVLTASARLQQLEGKLMVLKNDAAHQSYLAQLGKAYEAIRYCDRSVYVPTDAEIAAKIMKLEEVLTTEETDKDERVNTLTQDIVLLSKQRGMEAKSFKVGGV